MASSSLIAAGRTPKSPDSYYNAARPTSCVRSDEQQIITANVYKRDTANHLVGKPDWWSRAPKMTGTIKDEPPEGGGKLGHLESLNPSKVCFVFDIDGTTLLFNHNESTHTYGGAKLKAE
jgi:hypothetical protein